MRLDACASFCAMMSETLGPTVSEFLLIALAAALTWWRARKAITTVEVRAQAGIAAAHESASKAKAEARAAQVQLAEIRGSLRPVTPLPPTPSTATSAVNLEPVRIEYASAPSPEEPLPAPSAVPRDLSGR